VHCPCSRRGDVFGGGLSGSVGGTSGSLTTTSGSSIVVSPLVSPDGAPPSVGICTSGAVLASGSDGVRPGIGGGGPTPIRGGWPFVSCQAFFPRQDRVILWPTPLPPPHCCLPPGLQQWGASLTASGLAQYRYGWALPQSLPKAPQTLAAVWQPVRGAYGS